MKVCACLGPRASEPYCMCTMIQLGFRTEEDYKASTESIKELKIAFAQMFKKQEGFNVG